MAVCHLWALCLACSCPRPDPGSWPGCRLPLGLLHHAYHQILCSPPARWPSAPRPPPRLAQLPSPPHCFQILPQGHPPMAPVALRLTPCRGPVRFTVPPPTFQGVAFLCSWMNFPALTLQPAHTVPPPACSLPTCPALANTTYSPFRSWRGGHHLHAQSPTSPYILDHHLPHYCNSRTPLPSSPVSIRTPSVTIQNPTQIGLSTEG